LKELTSIRKPTASCQLPAAGSKQLAVEKTYPKTSEQMTNDKF
jgi:hypothetical protein